MGQIDRLMKKEYHHIFETAAQHQTGNKSFHPHDKDRFHLELHETFFIHFSVVSDQLSNRHFTFIYQQI